MRNVKIRRIIRRRVDHDEGGVSVAGDVQAVVSANVGDAGAASSTRASSRQRIVQKHGRTTVHEGGSDSFTGRRP